MNVPEIILTGAMYLTIGAFGALFLDWVVDRVRLAAQFKKTFGFSPPILKRHNIIRRQFLQPLVEGVIGDEMDALVARKREAFIMGRFGDEGFTNPEDKRAHEAACERTGNLIALAKRSGFLITEPYSRYCSAEFRRFQEDCFEGDSETEEE